MISHDSKSNWFIILFFTIAVLSLNASCAVAQSIWWEAESQNIPDVTLQDDQNSSGGQFLSLSVMRAPLTLKYQVEVKQAGKYQFMVRQTWPPRNMRYRWNNDDWQEMIKPVWLDRQMHDEGESWGWLTDGRFHDLSKGQYVLSVEMLSGGKDANGTWYPEAGFDCFVLTADSFPAVSTIKPNDELPESLKNDQARSIRKLSFWSTARELETIYTSSTITLDEHQMPYRLLAPEQVEAGKKYPLVIGLPSSGGRGNDNVAQLGACEPARVLAQPDFRKEYPCYVLVPQAPDWFSDEPRPRVTKTGLPMLTLLFNLIDQLESDHAVDPGRIYLTGQSLGGFGVCNAMERNADRFAAAVMVAGSTPDMGKYFAATPTWVFVGAYDGRKGQAEAIVQSIKAAGGNPQYTVIPGTGHVAWPKAYATDGFWEWLFKKRKTP